MSVKDWLHILYLGILFYGCINIYLLTCILIEVSK